MAEVDIIATSYDSYDLYVLPISHTPFPTLSFPSHVQVSNDDALQFYQKFGFRIVETKEQYYKRIDPPHAHVLQKDLKTPTSDTTGAPVPESRALD